MGEEQLNSVAFRRLDPETFELLRSAATRRQVPDGERLFDAGECDYRFFLVESGEVAIYEGSPDEGRLVAVHQPGEFTGDIDVLTGNPSLVTAVARGGCVVHEISADAIRRLIKEQPTVGDALLDAFIARRHLLERAESHNLRVIGSRYSPDTTRIRQFLSRNAIPFSWVDTETEPDLDRVLLSLGVRESDTPVVHSSDGLLHNPSNADLAEALGIRTAVEGQVFDLAIVGAGPAGLAAAVYAASEGLETVVLEQTAPGGQAGCSSRIENYLGFPAGIAGAELADNAMLQAYKFGATISTPSHVVALEIDGPHKRLRLDNGEHLHARSVLIASGAAYRRLDVPRREAFEGAGIYFSATRTEAPLCDQQEVIVVGGGNSAGQAAVFLAEKARRVHVVCRGHDLGATMSRYLVHRLQELPNVEILMQTQITELLGETALEGVRLRSASGEERELRVAAIFCMIGAVPRTDWLPPEIVKDRHGFVLTGTDVDRAAPRLARPRYLLETSAPGVFAAGDVRASSGKRVAAAVGEGAMAVQFVHRYLADG